MMHCFTCDRDFDEKTQDHAEYGKWPKCQDCVDDEHELQKQYWDWTHQDQNDEWIEANT